MRLFWSWWVLGGKLPPATPGARALLAKGTYCLACTVDRFAHQCTCKGGVMHA